jgi:hypothetical protein
MSSTSKELEKCYLHGAKPTCRLRSTFSTNASALPVEWHIPMDARRRAHERDRELALG